MPTPVVSNVLRYPPEKYLLDDKALYRQTAAVYSPRRTSKYYNGAPIRVRDDTITESDIPFCGQDLCTGTLLSWLSRNQVASIPLGTDGNSDGVSDGWTISNDGLTTLSNDINDNAQRLTITNASATGGDYSRKFYVEKFVTTTVGNSINCNVTVKTDGTVVAGLWLIFWNGATPIKTSDITTASQYAGYTTLSFSNIVAPANTTRISIRPFVRANISGDTGSVWFKDASVTISNQSAYVVTIYDQSGNANHATQTTAANQPRIVNAGIIERDFDATKASALYPTFASASGVTIISNGDFVNTAGWSYLAYSTVSATSNTLSCTGNGVGSTPGVLQPTATACVEGKRYFITFRVRVTNASCTAIKPYILGSTGGTLYGTALSNPVQNQWYTVSQTLTITGLSGTMRVGMRHEYADAATANGKVMEVQEVVCVDVTELGQPTMYFDGTNDVMTIANSASVDILGAPLMMSAVFNNNQAGYVFTKNGSLLNDHQYGVYYNATNQATELFLEGANRQSTVNSSTPINTQKIYTGTFEAAVQQGYVNGLTSGSAGNYNGALTSRANMQIGARSNNAGGTAWAAFFKGNISEIIILTSTSGRSKLEKNQGKFYQLGVA